jgi:hypothetical protein
MRDQPLGSLNAAYSKIGCQLGPSYGSMENVRFLILPRQLAPEGFPICVAGSGKSIIWCVVLFELSLVAGTHIDLVLQSSNTS